MLHLAGLSVAPPPFPIVEKATDAAADHAGRLMPTGRAVFGESRFDDLYIGECLIMKSRITIGHSTDDANAPGYRTNTCSVPRRIYGHRPDSK